MTAEQPKLERIMRAAAFKATEHRYEIEANIPQQFREWVEICSDGCWRWTGWICPQGYGHCYTLRAEPLRRLSASRFGHG